MAEAMYTISQLARQAGIPTTTLRYYERIGLIEPEDRSAGNYRLYSDESLRKVRFVRAAQSIGFTLDDIKQLLAAETGSLPRCGQVRELIEHRLSDVEQRLQDLRHVQKVLKAALKRCRQRKPSECCPVVEGLRATAH